MFNAFMLILVVLLLISSSLGYGTLSKNTKWYSKLPLGFFIILMLCQLLVPFAMIINIPAQIIRFGISLILFIGIILLIKNLRRLHFNKNDFKVLIMLIIFILVMVCSFSKQGLGLKPFDTVHYLAFVNHTQIADTFGKVDFATGYELSSYYISYDFQSYYYIFGTIQWLISFIQATPISLIYIFIWASSIFYFILNFTLYINIVDTLKIKNNAIKITLGLLYLGFFANLYFNKAFAFYGNTYRTLIVAFFVLETYKCIDKNNYNYSKIIMLSVMTWALIAVSSSGFFIGAVLSYSICAVLTFKSVDNLGKKVTILLAPIFAYASLYLGNENNMFVLFILLFIVISYLFVKFDDFSKQNKIKIIKMLKVIILLLPIFIALLSLTILSKYYTYAPSLFDNISNADMMWDYFRFDNKNAIIINTLLLVGYIIYFFIGKNKWFKVFILIAILTFINPVNMSFVYKFMANFVYYRLLDIIFNGFTILLVIYTFLDYIFVKNKVGFYIANALLIIVLSLLTSEQYFSYYHEDYFKLSKEDSLLYKISYDDVDIANVLNSNIFYGEKKEVKVVSHFLPLKGYVGPIITPMNYNHIRAIDEYSGNNDQPDDLFRVFYPRMYMSKNPFIQDIDYSQACNLLINEQIDYVILDKQQAYLNNDNIYFPLIYHVRDCATNIYENETYALYRFYWN